MPPGPDALGLVSQDPVSSRTAPMGQEAAPWWCGEGAAPLEGQWARGVAWSPAWPGPPSAAAVAVWRRLSDSRGG